MGHIPGELLKPRKLCWAGRSPHTNSIPKKQKRTLHREQIFSEEGDSLAETDLVSESESPEPLPNTEVRPRGPLIRPCRGDGQAKKAMHPWSLWKRVPPG